MANKIRSVFIEPVLNAQIKHLYRSAKEQIQTSELKIAKTASSADLLLVIGGDGSLLHALRQHQYTLAPFIGVHGGTLGFLQEIGSERLPEVLQQIASGQYQIERLPLLGFENNGHHGLAFNEVVIERASARAANLSIAVNDTVFEKFIGDGVIIATPQGSSAYAVAAGGALLSNGLSAMQLVPINAHNTIAYRSLQSSLVVDIHATITITNLDSIHRPLRIMVDGEEVSINKDAPITVRLSDKKVEMLRTTSYNYFATLAAKFIK